MGKMRRRDKIAIGGLVVLFLLMVVAFAVLGGDNSAGVTRSVDLDRAAPDPPCVIASLRQVEGVSDVKHKAQESDPSWSLPDFKRTDRPASDWYYYESGDASGSVHIVKSTSTGSHLDIIALDIHPGDPSRNFSPERIAGIRNLMDRIYAELAGHCGPLPPPSAVAEKCEELSCPPRPQPSVSVR